MRLAGRCRTRLRQFYRVGGAVAIPLRLDLDVRGIGLRVPTLKLRQVL